MIEFHNVPPKNIPFLPFKAVKYLEDAIRRTPGSTSQLATTLEMAARGYGNIYIVTLDEDIIGATYLITYDTPEGKILGIILLGGYRLHLWQDSYAKFIRDFMDSSNINVLRFIGRKGLAKMWPQSKIIGYICEIIK